MVVHSPYLAKPGARIKLSKISTDATGEFKSKEEGQHASDKNLKKLRELQNVMYAQGKYALLVVLQAMDAGGKDGAVDHVFSGINPQGCNVTSFKQPSAEELAHDYLWRIHHVTPKRGMIGIFNRSHYESVLVERVHDLVPEKVWSKRYEQINQFEKMLADDATIIIKFFLHISKKEQKERLQARLDDPSKNWKFDAKDLDERRHWDAYYEAYEDALAKCSTDDAPWIIVPSDHKWFRNWVISDTLVRALQKLDLKYPPPAKGLDNLVVE